MTDQQENHQLFHECEHDQTEQKRQKLEENVMEPIVEAKNPERKTITNIYYDCLERIFDFLDIEDLLNVACTCKRLQIAAAAKFDDEYCHWVYLYPFGSRRRISSNRLQTVVYGLNYCFPFLRCFGAKVSDLTLNYDTEYARYNHLDQYINQYCSSTLNCITYFAGKRTLPIGSLLKPFKNVEKVGFYSGDLGSQLQNCVVTFPYLLELIMPTQKISIDENAIEVHFPRLKKLDLFIQNEKIKNVFTSKNVVKFLRANRQLHELRFIIDLKTRLPLSTVLNMINENPSISKLELVGEITDVNEIELNRLANEHQLIEELYLLRALISPDDAVNFIRKMNSLKYFTFAVKNRSEHDRLLSQLDIKWKFNDASRRNCIEIALNCCTSEEEEEED